MKKQIFHGAAMIALSLMLASCAGETDTVAEGDVGAEESVPVDLLVPSGEYKVDPDHSILQWSVLHLGTSNYHARFTDFDVTIDLDADNLENSTVNAAIKADSIWTGFPGDYAAFHPDSVYPSWDKELGQSESYMFGSEFPEITFQSTAVEQTGPTTANITGDLTFRGMTKPVTLETSFIGQLEAHPLNGLPVIGFRAEGEVQVVDFGMEDTGYLGTSIPILFDGEFTGPDPAAGSDSGADTPAE